MEHSNRRNLNRGYMKLEVWSLSIALFKLVHEILSGIPKLDLRLRSQILDAVQSPSANISEGYCRRSIKEYLQFLYVALGSLGETMTRMIGLKAVGLIPQESFERFDALHYSVENNLLALVRSLQRMKRAGTWKDELPDDEQN